eukprot:jgi/Mesen1/3242/ME000187S02412
MAALALQSTLFTGGALAVPASWPTRGLHFLVTPILPAQPKKFARLSRGTAQRPLQPCRASCREHELEERASRRAAIASLAAAAAAAAGSLGLVEEAEAASARRASKGKKVPEEEYTTLPNGLKIYDVTVGSGPAAVKGSRVAVSIVILIQPIHYIAKWKGITFMTSRQGMGVTGGSPYGFDIGSSKSGIVLEGLDLGVEGMRVGGERLLLVPPELAYGNRGVQEIPPGATLEFNVELLSIKKDSFGTGVKLVEG